MCRRQENHGHVDATDGLPCAKYGKEKQYALSRDPETLPVQPCSKRQRLKIRVAV